jgi:hypothetical protein
MADNPQLLQTREEQPIITVPLWMSLSDGSKQSEKDLDPKIGTAGPHPKEC